MTRLNAIRAGCGEPMDKPEHPKALRNRHFKAAKLALALGQCGACQGVSLSKESQTLALTMAGYTKASPATWQQVDALLPARGR